MTPPGRVLDRRQTIAVAHADAGDHDSDAGAQGWTRRSPPHRRPSALCHQSRSEAATILGRLRQAPASPDPGRKSDRAYLARAAAAGAERPWCHDSLPRTGTCWIGSLMVVDDGAFRAAADTGCISGGPSISNTPPTDHQQQQHCTPEACQPSPARQKAAELLDSCKRGGHPSQGQLADALFCAAIACTSPTACCNWKSVSSGLAGSNFGKSSVAFPGFV